MITCLLNDWHFLPDNKVNAMPSHFIFFDTETKTVAEDKTIKLQWLKLGVANYVRLDSSLKVITDTWITFKTEVEFNQFVEVHAKNKRTLLLLASNMNFDLAVTQFEDYFKDRSWVAKSLYQKGMVLIITIKKGEKRIKILNLQNFLEGGIEAMGELLGKEKLKVNFKTVSMKQLEIYCKRDTEILRDSFLNYIKFLRDNDLGGFANTKSAQSLKAYRHRFMKHRLLVHKHKKALMLERNSYFGGFTECFQIGKVKAKTIYKLDINSMYPFVMKQNDYPYHFRLYHEKTSIDELKYYLRKFCCIAQVIIKTNEPIYPIKDNDKTMFPVGTFRTVICTQGLKYALEKNHIVSVERLVVYSKVNLFKDYVDYFYKLKLQYKDQGNEVFAVMTKYLLNSLYGKFAQKSDCIIKHKKVKNIKAFREDYYSDVTKKVGVEQVFFNVYTLTCGSQESFHSMPAVSSHVTEYARLYLFKLLDIAGRNNLYYCDTDSIFTNRKGVMRLNEYLHNKKIGHLKVEDQTSYLKIYGCKDYKFGNTQKIKGISKKAIYIKKNTYYVEEFPSFRSAIRYDLSCGYPIIKKIKTLKRIYDKGTVLSSGRVKPLVYSNPPSI